MSKQTPQLADSWHAEAFIPQQPWTSPPLLSLHLQYRPPLTGVRGYFGIKDVYRWVLEHFAHKNQHLYGPGFLTVSCNFRISSKCIVKKMKSCTDLCDHLTEIPPFRWVLTTCQYYKFWSRSPVQICVIIWQKYHLFVGFSQHASTISSLIVANWPLHYIIQNFKRPPPKFQPSMTQRASFPLWWTPLVTRRSRPAS